MGLPTRITRTQAETERVVQQGIAAQEAVIRAVRDALCYDPDCACCAKRREALRDVERMHAMTRQEMVAE